MSIAFIDLDVRQLTSRHDITAARQLHGRRYLEEGYVSALSEVGTIDDVFVDHSAYFGAFADGELVGAYRLIRKSSYGFPMTRNMRLDPTWAHLFEQIDDARCAEVSALVTARRGLASSAIAVSMYRHMFQIAIGELGLAYFFTIIDRGLHRLLTRTFSVAVDRVGPDQNYLGNTFPAVVYLPAWIERIERADTSLRDYFLAGLSLEQLESTVIDIRETTPTIAEPAVS